MSNRVKFLELRKISRRNKGKSKQGIAWHAFRFRCKILFFDAFNIWQWCYNMPVLEHVPLRRWHVGGDACGSFLLIFQRITTILANGRDSNNYNLHLHDYSYYTRLHLYHLRYLAVKNECSNQTEFLTLFREHSCRVLNCMGNWFIIMAWRNTRYWAW